MSGTLFLVPNLLGAIPPDSVLPARTIAEAGQRIKELTGVERKPTQVRLFLKGLGLRWQRVRAIPVPPKKTSPSTSLIKPHFSTAN